MTNNNQNRKQTTRKMLWHKYASVIPVLGLALCGGMELTCIAQKYGTSSHQKSGYFSVKIDRAIM